MVARYTKHAALHCRLQRAGLVHPSATDGQCCLSTASLPTCQGLLHEVFSQALLSTSSAEQMPFIAWHAACDERYIMCHEMYISSHAACHATNGIRVTLHSVTRSGAASVAQTVIRSRHAGLIT